MSASEESSSATDNVPIAVAEKEIGRKRLSLTQLRKEIDVLKKEKEMADKYLNQLKYLQADFENFKKRLDKEIDIAVQFSNEKLIKNLLSIIDELELAIKAGKETQNKGALIEGIEMVLKKLYNVLGNEGLTVIEALGKPFDPNKHQSFLMVSSKNQADGTVVEEVRKGFMFRGRIIRPSVVKVSCCSKHEKT